MRVAFGHCPSPPVRRLRCALHMVECKVSGERWSLCEACRVFCACVLSNARCDGGVCLLSPVANRLLLTCVLCAVSTPCLGSTLDDRVD
eukprot:10049847-Alexandrium_andersonii.AAC.1